MNHCKLTAIAILLLISLIGFCVPYAYTVACSQLTGGDLTTCFFRNASVTVLRALPIGLALLVAVSARKKRR